MKTIKISLVVLMITLLLPSCTVRMVDFTVISSKNHTLKFDIPDGKQVKGRSMAFLGFGTSIKDAMDDALQTAGPEYDLLVNGVVRKVGFLKAGYEVEGVAINSRKLEASMGNEEFKEWCKVVKVFQPDEVETFEN